MPWVYLFPVFYLMACLCVFYALFSMAGAVSFSLAQGGMATRSRAKPGPSPEGVEMAPTPGSANKTAVPAFVEAPASATNSPGFSRSCPASSASHPCFSGSASSGPLPARRRTTSRAETDVFSLARCTFVGGSDCNDDEEEVTSKWYDYQLSTCPCMLTLHSAATIPAIDTPPRTTAGKAGINPCAFC
jgi:hypothetical protein